MPVLDLPYSSPRIFYAEKGKAPPVLSFSVAETIWYVAALTKKNNKI
jgi:hypothetical protein